MFSSKWKSISEWLLENHDTLSNEEKQYWIDELAEQNDKILEQWSEQLELLDEVKEKLLTSTPLSFNKKEENLQGINYFHIGLYSKAIEVLHAELEHTEHSSRVYLYLAFSYLYINNLTLSKEHFLNVVHRSNDPLEKHYAFLGLGLQAGKEDDVEQAISYFEKAEQLQFNPDVVYNLGICYLLLKMPNQAQQYFKEVIQAGEGDGEAYYWLGKSYMDAGEKTLAMETWYQAVHGFDSEQLLLSLALEFEEKNLFSCALFCYERLNDLGYDESIVLHGISWNYGLMDERIKAKQGFQELLRHDPQNINAWISYLWLINTWEDSMALKAAKVKIQSYNLRHPLIQKMTEKIYSQH
ncbi:tetratricopeptide repeat protein [Evansella sp. AB-rgal1]|uniref:tetratricopeptide repeat protein n=1 Tax=Evansella sp. AB-rgal1 TaxID=3242696 RepID=UPI00359EC28F